jgi:hypothetical protein
MAGEFARAGKPAISPHLGRTQRFVATERNSSKDAQELDVSIFRRQRHRK